MILFEVNLQNLAALIYRHLIESLTKYNAIGDYSKQSNEKKKLNGCQVNNNFASTCHTTYFIRDVKAATCDKRLERFAVFNVKCR